MEIPLTRGYVALVDDDDFPELSERKWSAMEVSPGKVYATSACSKSVSRNGYQYMHRVILDAKKGEYVDHADGNTLNNQRDNIRICTHAQNLSNRAGPQANNTSGYIGVCWNKSRGKWQAQVRCKNKDYYLGQFDDPVEAARVRDAKARELHGEYAYLNLPEEG